MPLQKLHLHVAALAAAHVLAFGFAKGHRLARALGDKFMLDLGGQSECEAQHLAVDAVVEDIAVFGAVNLDLVIDAVFHDLHNFMQ